MVYTIILRFKNILRHLIIIFVMLNYFCCIKFRSSATIKVYNSKDYFLLGYQSKCDITFTMETYFCNFFSTLLLREIYSDHSITLMTLYIQRTILGCNRIYRIIHCFKSITFEIIIYDESSISHESLKNQLCLCFSLVCKFPMKRSIILFSK